MTEENTNEEEQKDIGEEIIEGLENEVEYALGGTDGDEVILEGESVEPTKETSDDPTEDAPDASSEGEITETEEDDEGIVAKEEEPEPKPKKKISSRVPDYTKEDPLKKKLETWQGADHLRKLLVTTGSTIGHYHQEGLLFQGKYRIEGQPSKDRKHCLDYRAVDVTTEDEEEEVTE